VGHHELHDSFWIIEIFKYGFEDFDKSHKCDVEMVEMKNIKALFVVTWLIILIALWVMFPFMPGNTLFWMWLAICWSLLGAIVFAIYVMIKAIKYVILVGLVWTLILTMFIVDGFVTHLIFDLMWFIIAWIGIGVILIICIVLLKKTNKTEW
jgi:hypothetical protein